MPFFFYGQPAVAALAVFVLTASCLWALRRLSQLPAAIKLHVDGRVDLEHSSYAVSETLGSLSRHWPALVVLQLGKRWLLLSPDNMADAESWRQLQVWMHWAAQPSTSAPISDEAE